MVDIEKIEWESKYSVYIEEIDAHQKKMFEMFNQLIEMKESKTDAKLCINMVSEINEYSKLYFSSEEKYLRKKGYPDFAAHSKAHRQFIKNSISLRREISENIENLTNEVIEALRNWMIEHILNLDASYVPFLRITKHIEASKRKS